MAPVGFLETGVIYCDDNLHRLSQFPDECIDLIYLDPPFFSNRHHEVIWGDEAEVRAAGRRLPMRSDWPAPEGAHPMYRMAQSGERPWPWRSLLSMSLERLR